MTEGSGGRMRRAIMALFLTVMVMTAGLVSGPSSLRFHPSVLAQEPRTDLPAIAVWPSDITSANYLVVDGRSCFTPTACADGTYIAGATADGLEEGGLRQAYALRLDQLNPEGTGTIRILATTIAEYDSASDANDGLSSFLVWLADPAAKVQVEGNIGQGAEMFVIRGPVVGDPNSTGGVGLRFRSGALVVGIEIREYSGTSPDSGLVARLARRVVRRIGDAQDAAGLGALAVHHRGSASELYAQKANTTIPLYGESATNYSNRSAEFTNAGVEDVFLSRQVLVEGNDPQNPEIVLAIALYRLSDASSASTYLDDASTTFTIGWEQVGLPYTEPEEPPLVGDQSIWYLNAFQMGYQVVAFVRQGDIVARIIWQRNDPSQQGPSTKLLSKAETDLLAGAEYTAAQQTTCIRDGGCPGVVRLSSRLLP